MGRGIEIGRARKRGLGDDGTTAAREDVGAQRVLITIASDEHPSVGDAREVERMQSAGSERGAALGLVVEAQLALTEDGEPHGAKDFGVNATRAGGAHGDEFVERRLHEVAGFTEQAAGDFVEGSAEFRAEIDAFEDIEGLAGDDECDAFVLAEIVAEGERSIAVGVAIGALTIVVFDGKSELIAKIRDVALDGLGGRIEVSGERGAIDAARAPGGFVELIVDLEQTGERDFGGGILVGTLRRFHGGEDTGLTPPRDG